MEVDSSISSNPYWGDKDYEVSLVLAEPTPENENATNLPTVMVRASTLYTSETFSSMIPPKGVALWTGQAFSPDIVKTMFDLAHQALLVDADAPEPAGPTKIVFHPVQAKILHDIIMPDSKKFNIDLWIEYMTVQSSLKIPIMRSLLAELVAECIGESSPEEIQEMCGFEGKFTEEDEKKIVEKFPFLA